LVLERFQNFGVLFIINFTFLRRHTAGRYNILLYGTVSVISRVANNNTTRNVTVTAFMRNVLYLGIGIRGLWAAATRRRRRSVRDKARRNLWPQFRPIPFPVGLRKTETKTFVSQIKERRRAASRRDYYASVHCCSIIIILWKQILSYKTRIPPHATSSVRTFVYIIIMICIYVLLGIYVIIRF